MLYGHAKNGQPARTSLKTKIIAASSGFVLLFMVVGSYCGLLYIERHLKSAVYSQETALAASMADEIDGKIAFYQAVATAIAGSITPEILGDRQKAQQFMDGRKDLRQMFDNGVFLFLSNGMMQAGDPFEPLQQTSNYAYREYFQKTMATGKPYISEPYFTSQRHHHPAVMFTAPIRDHQGKILGFFGGSIDLMKDNFLGKIAATKIGRTGYFVMLDRHRHLIVHPDRNRILKDIVKPGTNRLTDRAFAGIMETGENVTSFGLPMVSAFRPIKTTGWVLSANSPQAEAYAPIMKARKYIYIAVPTILLLSLLSMWLLLNKLTAPLLRFTAHVKKVAADDEQKAAAVETSDEIGSLAAEFNRMLAELNVKKRTVQEQLRFLQVLMDTIPAPVFYKDMAGRYLGCNTPFTEYLGMDRNQIIGKTVYDIAPKELAAVYHAADQKLAEQHGKQVYETRIRYADGSYHEVIFYKAIFTNSEQVPEGLVGIMLDITDRKRAEETLRDMGERFQQLFSQNWDAVLLLSPNTFRIMDANPAAAHLFGCDSNSLMLKDLATFLASEDRTRLAALLAGSDQTDTVQIDRATIIPQEGAPLTVSIRCKLVKTASEALVYCSFRDIGERLRLEKEMKETQARLIHANRMTALGVLTAGIAHEINNPNSYISANATLLVEAWNDAVPVLRRHVAEHGEVNLGGLPFSEMEQIVPRLCSGLTEGSRRISAIVDNLKGFYRDQKNTQPTPFDINKAISDAVAILSHHVHKQTSHFSVSLGDNLPLVRGKSQQIEQVLVNLVMNSLQALPDKTKGVAVSSAFDRETGFVTVTVRDEGRGMAPDVLERLTEPFFSTRLDQGGTGLGLSITEAIVKEHGGVLLFQSAPGEGTTAKVLLPAAGAPPAMTAEES